jgi:hypothetical protein
MAAPNPCGYNAASRGRARGFRRRTREVLQAMTGAERASTAGGAAGQLAPALFVSHGAPLEARSTAPRRPGHLLPLHFVLGAALPEDRLTPVYEGFHHASLSMRSCALRAGPLPAETPQ